MREWKIAMLLLQIPLLFLFYLPVSQCVSVSTTDANVLLKVKEDMDPDNAILSTWKTANNCTDWVGVTCSSTGSVIKLQLTNVPFSTGISSEIGNLNDLQTLDLSEDNLFGELPTSLGNLINLNYLYLSVNNFGAAIPETICKLKKLKSIKASTAGITGAIPSCIGNMTALQSITLDSNGFTDVLPDSICKLSKLDFLNLSTTTTTVTWTLPDCLGNLTALKTLDLGGNNLNGSMPSSLTKTKLAYLDLSGFNYTGSFPSFFGKITTLKYLLLKSIKFEGKISDSICDLNDLSILNLNGASVSSFPSCFSSLKNLKYLDVHQNNFAGDLPSFISKLTALEYLDMGGNSFTGEIPSDIGNLVNLSYLDLSSNKLRGSIPTSIGNLKKLSILTLEVNRLVGNIPSEITMLSNLQSLNLGINIFNGNIPDQIGDMKNIFDLRLNSNNLTGTIPSSIGSLTSLTYLTLRNNHLEGDVPSEITNLRLLQTLQLNGNNLSTLPANLDKLSSLNELDLSYNNFEGNIPTEIGNITSISTLKLQSNKFSGNIPDLSKLSLTEIYLFKNNLEGSIPTSLFKIGSLQTIYFHDNMLSGKIPAVNQMGLLSEIILDNNKLSGTLPSNFSGMVLATFSASNNFLTGRVSSSLAKTVTGKLSLSNNLLTGKIPTKFDENNLISYVNLADNNLEGEVSQFSTLPKLKYLFLSRNSFTATFDAFNLTNVPQLVQFRASSSGLSGNIPSLENTLNLLKLDLSENRLTGNLPKIDDSLQYIDLSNNELTGSVNFDLTKFPNGSFISLQQNSLVGSVSNELYNTADIDIYLSGNPACESSTATACTSTPSFTNTWKYQSFCENIKCFGDTSPNPSVFNSSGECFCSGYLSLIIELLSPPFARFEDQTAFDFARNFLTAVNSLSDNPESFEYTSQIQVLSANQTSTGHQLLEVRLYSSDGGPFIPRYAWSIIDGMFTNNLFCGDYFGPSSLASYNFVFRSSFTGKDDTRDGSPRKKAFTSTPIFIIVIVVIALLALCIVLAAFLRYKKKDSSNVGIKVNQQLIPFIGFKVIEESTNHFSESNKIGTCGSAFIYRGNTREGNLIAVKRNFDLNAQTAKDFKNEVETLSKLRNSNLLRLIGYCNDFNEQICVFEFVPNGTLWDILHSPDNSYPIRLSFKQRLRIALGSVEGLSYLISSPKYHQMKHIVDSHNIFIDNNLQAIVSVIEFKPKSLNAGEDGGSFREDKMSMVYIDPQFINSGRLTTESVVYSFGVVLLELITGKKPLIEEEDLTVVEWVTELANSNKLSQIVDSRLGVNYSMDSVKRMMEIALSCVEKIPSNRPNLQEIARALTDIDGPMEPDQGAVKIKDSLLSSSVRSDDSV